MWRDNKLLGHFYFKTVQHRSFSVLHPFHFFGYFSCQKPPAAVGVNLAHRCISWSMVRRSGLGCYKGTPRGDRWSLCWLGMGMKIYCCGGLLVSVLSCNALESL